MEDTEQLLPRPPRAQHEIDMSRSRTSTTTPESCRRTWRRWWTCDGSVPASGSSSSRTPARSTNARSAGCRRGTCSVRSRRRNPGSKTRCSSDCAPPAQDRARACDSTSGSHSTAAISRRRASTRWCAGILSRASCPAGRVSSTSSARRTSRSLAPPSRWTSSTTARGEASATPAPDSANSCRMRTAWPAGRCTFAGFVDPSAGGPGGRADCSRYARW